LPAAPVERANQCGPEKCEPVLDAHILDQQPVTCFFGTGPDPTGEFLAEVPVGP
jgi:hypothetical protein